MKTNDIKDFALHISRFDARTIDSLFPILFHQCQGDDSFLDEEIAESLVYFFDGNQNSRKPPIDEGQLRKKQALFNSLEQDNKRKIVELLNMINGKFKNSIFEEDLASALLFWGNCNN